MKKTTKLILAVLVAVLVMAGAGVGVVKFFAQEETKTAAPSEVADAEEEAPSEEADPEEAEKNYQQIQGEVVQAQGDPVQNTVNFEELQKINPDAYAWIQIPGTNVDYPILQSTIEADDYYLNTTIDGKQGYPGSIYTEKYNSTSFADPVTVVYGHNMREGTMFADLHKYTDRAFMDSNPYVYIYLPDTTLKYQIFAAVAYDDRYILGNYNFTDKDDFQKYLDELRSSINGNVNQDIEVTQESKILTLSTCISEYPEQRWLVNATLVTE